MPIQKLISEELKAKRKARDAAYYAKNKERILAQKAEYYTRNREDILDKVHAYRAENPDKIIESKRRWLQNNYAHAQEMWAQYALIHKDERRLRAAEWCRDNPERAAAVKLAWARANKDKVNASHARNYRENPKAALIRWHNREARKRAQGGSLSKDLVERLHKQQQGLCACCQVPLGADYHMDHIMPLALGGAHEDWNIQLLTKQCNLSKGAKHPDDFMKLRRQEQALCQSKN